MASKEAGQVTVNLTRAPFGRHLQKMSITAATLIALLATDAATAQQRRQAAPKRAASSSAPAAPASASSEKRTDSNIVAVVNREQITRDQLGNECLRRYGKEVLESEVNKHLILQECKRQNVTISAADVEAEVERMANKFGFSVDRWLEMLQSERDVTPQQYRRDIVWPTLALRSLAKEQTTVSEAELKKAFDAEFGEGVQVRMIVANSRQRAEQLLAAAKAKPDEFDKLAKDQSEDENSAATRGLIPPIRRHVGDPRIEKAAFALRPGEISPVVEAVGQFLILKCERKIPAAKLTAEQKAKADADLRSALEDRKLRMAASNMFRQLQADAEIVNIFNDSELRKQSPDTAATINGGRITIDYLKSQCIKRHGDTVLEGEINRTLLMQALRRRSQQVTQADLQEEIRRAALSYGFTKPDETVDVDGWLKNVTAEGDVTVDTYVRDAVWPTVALKKIVGSSITISDEDLQKGFVANYGERVEVLAVVLSSQRTAHEVFDLARRNDSEKFFGELAHQYSIESVSRANFGQVPPIRRFGGQPLLEEEAFKLKPGETSGVLAIADKFIILRCLGRTKPVVDSLADVRDELEKDLREKKMRLAMGSEFDRLKERAQIDNFLAGTSQQGDTKAKQASFTSPDDTSR